MKPVVLFVLNFSLLALFLFFLRKPKVLSYYSGGRWYLTWLSIAVITLMDELTSVFYASAEAYRFLGPSAIFFIAFTSLFIHYTTTRLVEIAEILEHHKLIGGGVYSFSYLVLGPMVSFVAVASIMVDYTLTACMSAVSAVLNALSFFLLSPSIIIAVVLGVIWSIAGLNILGIRENARFTFAIFMVASFVFLNLIFTGIIHLDGVFITHFKNVLHHTYVHLQTGSLIKSYDIFIASVASCVLAYSGVESVLQTAGLVRSWQEIKKAYIFLALTVGIVTPTVAALALSAPIDFSKHEGDLITHFATVVNGVPFGIVVAALASFTLIMAVNTAFVASSELLERVAHRYGFLWLIATNRQHSLYRIHFLNAVFFSAIILVTGGQQKTLADMYAIGLTACFCINLGSLLIYRYFRGTKEVVQFHTSRLITLIIWVVFVSCFVFLAIKKPYGTMMWATATTMVMVGGFIIARRRAPEIKEIEKTDNEMEMILQLAQTSRPEIHIYFRRPREEAINNPQNNEAYITFYSPREGIPSKLSFNHYRFPLVKTSLYQRMVALLKVIEYEFPNRQIIVHFGWPMSSWLDRLSIGVMVFNLMRLPRIFPQFQFIINYLPQKKSFNSVH